MDDNLTILRELVNIGDAQEGAMDVATKNTESLRRIEEKVNEPVEPPVVVVPDSVEIRNFPETQRVEVINQEPVDFTTVEELLARLIKIVPEIRNDEPTEAIKKLSDYIFRDQSKKEIIDTLKKILEREYPTYELPNELLTKDGRIKVEVDRAGGFSAAGLLTTSDFNAKANSLIGMEIPAHNYISLAQASLTDTWTYKTGGAGGTTVATVTVTYTDSGKGTISSVAKT